MPGQGLLEGLGEVEEAPADDHVVVERHEEAHLQGQHRGQGSAQGQHMDQHRGGGQVRGPGVRVRTEGQVYRHICFVS